MCGTHGFRTAEELFLHQRSETALRARYGRLSAGSGAVPHPANADSGNIAILSGAGGVVTRRNPFDLDHTTLAFVPTVSGYRYETSSGSYDATIGGTHLTLDDDDTRPVPLPFAFSFYGVKYTRLWVNSDGNITFETGDSSSSDRSLGRLFSGAPRIAPLLTDLDPSQARDGVFVRSESGRFTATWLNVPLYSDQGGGATQSFQVRLYPDGRIEFTWNGVDAPNAVVGIAPGRLAAGSSVVAFATDPSGGYAGAVAESFSGSEAVDAFLAAQRFYETHDDAYDYLVLFNNESIRAAPGAVAYELTARNTRTGIGERTGDAGKSFGSAGRLQAVLNMGSLSQYPADPNAVVPTRAISKDTPLSLLGHEAGHLFLAYASVRDPNDPAARPMLGRQRAHWSFAFNSEASFLEGNRIVDNGPDASPRFTTTATVEGYSPLDQYLMGLRPASDVPPVFLVENPTTPIASRGPQAGISFDGTRRGITVDDVIAAEGRRIPDSTVAQRRFRLAFVLISPGGDPPATEDLAKIDAFRSQFEEFFARATSNNAAADTALRRAVQFSPGPAAGLLAGVPGTANIRLDVPTQQPLTLALRSASGLVSLPASVTIPAGGSAVSFALIGLAPGVDEITALPSNSGYETRTARIAVAAAPSRLKLALVSDLDPAQVRVTDENELPYSGIQVAAGNRMALTGADGIATFRNNGSALTFSLAGGPSLTLVPIAAAGAVNAASFVPAIAPGSLATLFGTGLAGAAVALNGVPARVLFANANQVNFVVPPDIPEGPAELSATSSGGAGTSLLVNVSPVSPGLFGAVRRGGFVEIYGTGFGTALPQVVMNGEPARVVYTGKFSPGLTQVNAKIPDDAGGPLTIRVSAAGVSSNPVIARE